MVDVILGLQWGDEGKGKIVDFFAKDYEVIARFQGGPNAGHTLYVNGSKVVLHQIPSGIFHKDKINLIGNGVVGEIKVSTKPMKQIYTKYKDQMQWQMHVTGANKALFIVQNRHNNFNEAMWVPRDIERISRLNRPFRDWRIERTRYRL